MIENRQREMRLALPIRLDQQIASPHAIARHRAWDTVLQFPPCREDPILVASAHVRDIGLAHRHLFAFFPSSIEVMGDGTTARLRHQDFQSNDLALDPPWLGLGEGLARW